MMIAIVGFGYVGASLGAYLGSRGAEIIAIDKPDQVQKFKHLQFISEKGVSKVLTSLAANRKIQFTSDYSLVAKADVIIVSVGTPLVEVSALSVPVEVSAGGARIENQVDFSQLDESFEDLIPHLQAEQMILLKSTVPAGTSLKIQSKILQARGADFQIHFAYSPERVAEGNALEEFAKIPVLFGVDQFGDRGGVLASIETQKCFSEFFKKYFDQAVIPMSSTTAAELTKLVSNLWIDVNIALANEIEKVTQALGISSKEVIAASNTLQKGQSSVNIMSPGIGVGGYCIPKDPLFIEQTPQTAGLHLQSIQFSRYVNQQRAKDCFEDIKKHYEAQKGDFSQAKIAVLGLSFKNNSGDLRSSPSLEILSYLMNENKNILVHDPLIDSSELPSQVQEIYKKSHLETVEKADLILFLNAHDSFKHTKPGEWCKNAAEKALIYDGRGLWNQSQLGEFKKMNCFTFGIN